jgi:hypothetical protein
VTVEYHRNPTSNPAKAKLIGWVLIAAAIVTGTGVALSFRYATTVVVGRLWVYSICGRVAFEVSPSADRRMEAWASRVRDLSEFQTEYFLGRWGVDVWWIPLVMLLFGVWLASWKPPADEKRSRPRRIRRAD